jgi:hypothetical protein
MKSTFSLATFTVVFVLFGFLHPSEVDAGVSPPVEASPIECKGTLTSSQYQCTFITPIYQIVANQDFLSIGGTSRSLHLGGLDENFLHLDAWNGAGNAILDTCQELALKVYGTPEALKVVVTWAKAPDPLPLPANSKTVWVAIGFLTNAPQKVLCSISTD